MLNIFSYVHQPSVESLNYKEIKQINPKGNQCWIYIGRTDAEAPILWPPDTKNWFFGKDPDAGKDWKQEEKVMTEDKMVWWHHQLDGHEFEQAWELVMNREASWDVVHGVTESDTTEQLNWTELLNIQLFKTSKDLKLKERWSTSH